MERIIEYIYAYLGSRGGVYKYVLIYPGFMTLAKKAYVNVTVKYRKKKLLNRKWKDLKIETLTFSFVLPAGEGVSIA